MFLEKAGVGVVVVGRMFYKGSEEDGTGARSCICHARYTQSSCGYLVVRKSKCSFCTVSGCYKNSVSGCHGN